MNAWNRVASPMVSMENRALLSGRSKLFGNHTRPLALRRFPVKRLKY